MEAISEDFGGCGEVYSRVAGWYTDGVRVSWGYAII